MSKEVSEEIRMKLSNRIGKWLKRNGHSPVAGIPYPDGEEE
tara:strand:- start:96 stop:218 length:123 start_codon:yes stop_codon:yes gene_type:complete